MAALLGSLSVAGGIGVSLAYDTPTGPTIVVVALVLFLISSALPDISRQR